ncbi:beta-galactosidase [soil metagenome]
MTRKHFLPSALALFVAVSPLIATIAASAQSHTQPHTFAVDQDHFALDGKPFKVLSGELHYARIPRAYWHARLKMAKAMGLNTIATYVFWNVHEPTQGHYDFSGNNDLAAFIKAAQEEGLYVILRSGPYSCAEWELGGFPAWLLKDPASAAVLRSNDPIFMAPTERWIHRLAQEVAPLQLGHGGPILMTQVENEYGNFDHDHVYMEHLKKIFEESGFNASLLYSADNWRNIPGGSIPGLYAATNFGIGNHKGGMDALEKVRPGQPLFVSEYWPGWFDHWGHPHETRPTPPQLEDLDYILHRGAGINIYMFHGGTSFGFLAGSSNISGKFLPDVTSYDYDAPLDEAGHATPKFLAYRKILATYSACGNESCLPAVPAAPGVITIPQINLTESTPLWQNLPAPIASDTPQPIEHFDQSYGYILYRTKIAAATIGDLTLTDLHDYAQIYLDGKLAGTLVRHNADSGKEKSTLAITTTGPAQLDILVANDGRINSTKAMRIESKGITKSVTLSGTPLTGWQIYTLPMTSLPTRFKAGVADGPHFSRATFNLGGTGDTFLDIRNLGKGALWINGHPIGRFWNVGPQQTLYVPAPWLRKGRNEIVAFDLLPTATTPHVAGLAQPILDGPTPDKTKSKQE